MQECLANKFWDCNLHGIRRFLQCHTLRLGESPMGITNDNAFETTSILQFWQVIGNDFWQVSGSLGAEPAVQDRPP